MYKSVFGFIQNYGGGGKKRHLDKERKEKDILHDTNIYKGADSIEIGRLTRYDETKNPFRNENISEELKVELKNISEEWIYFFRNEIIHTFETMDLNRLPKLEDSNEYGLSKFEEILYSLNPDFITQEYGLSYYEGINNFCINNPVDKDLLDEIVIYLIGGDRDSNISLMKDNNEVYMSLKECDNKELYLTIRKLFILLFSNSQPFGLENYFEYYDEKKYDINYYKNYTNKLSFEKITKLSSEGDDLVEKIFPYFIYRFRDRLPALIKLSNLFKNKDRVAALLSTFSSFRENFTLSKLIVMLDFFSNWMPSFKCYFSKIRFPYNSPF